MSSTPFDESIFLASISDISSEASVTFCTIFFKAFIEISPVSVSIFIFISGLIPYFFLTADKRADSRVPRIDSFGMPLSLLICSII